MTHEQKVEWTARWLREQLGDRPMPKLLVVIGLGSGEVLDVLARWGETPRVLALEPDPIAARSFRARPECAAWVRSGRVIHLTGPDYTGADDAWRIWPDPDAHCLVVNPDTARLHRDGALGAARLLKRIVFGARANAAARRQFAPRYLLNTLRNAASLVAGRDIDALAGAYRNVPAVVVGAGPSLDGSLDDLRGMHDRAVLIAADTALRPLLEHGVKPNFAVGLDPSLINARHFQSLPDCSTTWLVAESALDPAVPVLFGDRTLWFRVADHQPWPWYRTLGLDVGQLDVWGSVLTAAFQVALLAGCDPIVFVGADLAYTKGRPYARGTTYEFDWAYAAATGADLELAWSRQVGMFEQLHVPDLHGVETLTTAPLQAFRDWMVAHAGRSGRRIINATGSGIFFGSGIEQLPLLDALGTRYTIASPSRLHQPRMRLSGAELSKHFSDLKPHVKDASVPLVHMWMEFSAGGYDGDAVGDALGDASHALAASQPPEPPNVQTAGGPDVCRRPGARPLLSRLPESLGRFRAALTSIEPLPAMFQPDGADRHALAAIAEAKAMMGALREELVSFVEDPDAPLARSSTGVAPVSGICAWPAGIAWPLYRFEALLGEACAIGWPGARSSFFSRPLTVRRADAAAPPGGTHSLDVASAADRVALEWLLCASLVHQLPSAIFGRLLGLFHAMQRAVEPSSTATPATDILAVDLVGSIGTPFHATELSVRCDRPSLARALTGIVSAPRASLGRRAAGAAAGLADDVGNASVWSDLGASLRLHVDTASVHAGAEAYPAPLLITPRVLTDEGLPPSVLGYTTARGAVLVPLARRESVLVLQDGNIETHRSWPRPIIGELPLGLAGTVAWHNEPESTQGYVMYRATPEDTTTIVPLPFRPSVGTWWRDRLYWTVFPTGLGSWAPGEDPTLESPDVTLLALHAHATGLVLAPCHRDANGALRREGVSSGWNWRPGAPRERVPFGTAGAASCRSSDRGWTAVAHPEADVIRLASDAGIELSVACYYPFTVAWAGPSLVVTTVEGEVLLFEDLIGSVESWLGAKASAFTQSS